LDSAFGVWQKEGSLYYQPEINALAEYLSQLLKEGEIYWVIDGILSKVVAGKIPVKIVGILRAGMKETKKREDLRTTLEEEDLFLKTLKSLSPFVAKLFRVALRGGKIRKANGRFCHFLGLPQEMVSNQIVRKPVKSS
jgi:PAS domain-containing protein